MSNITLIIVIAVAIVALLIVGYQMARKRRSEQLRGQYSPDYDPLSPYRSVSGEDSIDGVVVGLGPVGVTGPFDLPFRHLAFDHAR